MLKSRHQLILVTQKQQTPILQYLKFIEHCIHHGITAVQLREKHCPFDQLIVFARQLHALLAKYNIPLIINDNIELALLLDADGVHLGQQDGDVIQARKCLGKNKIIGLTVNSLHEVTTANALPIDYIGIGAIFPTQNKPNVQHHWGCIELQHAVSQTKHPTIAIGGITLSNAEDVITTGVDGIAAINLFHQSHDIGNTIHTLKTLFLKKEISRACARVKGDGVSKGENAIFPFGRRPCSFAAQAKSNQKIISVACGRVIETQEKIMLVEIETSLQTLRKNKPIILNLTNVVTMEFMANTLLALGSSPIMSVCEQELAELVQIATAINLNIGTLDDAFINRCLSAAKLAKQHNKPVIVDPVGAGASQLRTQAALLLLDYADVVRGNASEILALTNANNITRGVDANHSTTQAKTAAIALAKQYQCTVVVSGEIDFMTDGERQKTLQVGHPLMAYITGMGCTLTAVIAAFNQTKQDCLQNSYLATAYFGLCGTIASHISTSPGTFRQHFIDAIYQADLTKIDQPLEVDPT